MEQLINGKSVLAIVPARAGSKGLPGKNIIGICGKPLIAWSIEAGLSSEFIDEIIVSTDSAEIAQISIEWGAKVPFIRPAEISTDETPTFDVIEHAVEFYKQKKFEFDFIVILEPTSPLRTALDIDLALKTLAYHQEASAIVGISSTTTQNPSFLVRKGSKAELTPFIGTTLKAIRRQDVEEVFFIEGSVYISKTHELFLRKTFYHEGTIGFEVPKWKSFEIDDLEDLIVVEALMRKKILGL